MHTLVNEFGSESYGKAGAKVGWNPANGTFNTGSNINVNINFRSDGSARCEVDNLFRAAKPSAGQQCAQIVTRPGSTQPSAAVKGSRVTIFDPKDGAYHLGTVVDIKDGRSQHILHIRWKQFGSGWFPVRSRSLKKFEMKRGSTRGFGVLA